MPCSRTPRSPPTSWRRSTGSFDRLSFDAPIHSLADVDALPMRVRHLNIKPSRFGPLSRLFECIDACLERGVELYGGGQFELGVGRGQIQEIASLFYPDTPNDVAPPAYNSPEPVAGLPQSPLPPPPRRAGFGCVIAVALAAAALVVAPPQAGDRAEANPVRATAPRRDGRVLQAPLRHGAMATDSAEGDRRALHGE